MQYRMGRSPCEINQQWSMTLSLLAGNVEERSAGSVNGFSSLAEADPVRMTSSSGNVSASSFPAASSLQTLVPATTADVAPTHAGTDESSGQNTSGSTLRTSVSPTQLGAAGPPLQPSSTAVTFFRRALPSPPAIAFSSQEGQAIFREALVEGNMAGFFKLMQEFRTQDEPAFCGLASVAMVLNALSIDPRRTWKGAWRYFHESLLDCCTPLDKVKEEGVVLQQAACLARCNGARCKVVPFNASSLEEFRERVQDACASGLRHIVASYSRKQFLQSGDGHFSPIGGYHKGRDLVLILDTARFKYPPHWVPLSELYQAMGRIDPVTGNPRGYLILDAPEVQQSLLFTLGRGHREQPSVPHVITPQAVREVLSSLPGDAKGEQAVAALLQAVSPREVASFVVVREERGCQAEMEGDAASPCSLPAAASQLLAELQALPLYKLIHKLLERGASPSCTSHHSQPFFAERLTMLLLLLDPTTFDSLPSHEHLHGSVIHMLQETKSFIHKLVCFTWLKGGEAWQRRDLMRLVYDRNMSANAREEMAELMTIDPRKGGIVVAELRYLQRQLAELPLLDKLEGPPATAVADAILSLPLCLDSTLGTV